MQDIPVLCRCKTLRAAEAAFHDLDKQGVERNDAKHNAHHELFLMCDDITATLRDLAAKHVPVSAVSKQRWGQIATVTLPGGRRLGIYEPKHPKPRLNA